MKDEEVTDQGRAKHKESPDDRRGVFRAYIDALGRMGATAEAAVRLAISARTVGTGEEP